jgi:TonB family protein
MRRMRRLLPIALLAALLSSCGSSAPAPAPQAEPEPVATPPSEAPGGEAVIGSVTITATTANVRHDPSTNAAVLTQVTKGERLPLLGAGDEWMKVRLASGESGWVSKSLVAREGERASRAQAHPRPATWRGGCPPDSDYRFTRTPTPTFSDSGKHGLVVVEASVNANGEVTSTRLVSNETGDEALGILAQREMKSARFSPPIRNCLPKAFIFTYKRSF